MRMKLDRAYYTSNMTEIDPVEYGGEVEGFAAYKRYWPTGAMSAMAFYGKQAKPIWHYNFKSDAAMLAKVKEAAEGRKLSVDYKAKRKAEKAAFVPSVKIGDVFGTCWGWEQTNREFYQVVGLPSAKTVTLQEIAQDVTESGFMAGKTKPIKDMFIGKSFTKRIGEGNTIRFASYNTASLVDPDKEYYVSWYA